MNKENPFIKGVKGLMPYILTPAMLVYIIWASAEYKTESKQLQFDSVDQRIKTKNHVNTTPNDYEMYEALKKFDSVLEFQKMYNEETKKSRKRKDSIAQLDRVTLYQLKEEVRKQNLQND